MLAAMVAVIWLRFYIILRSTPSVFLHSSGRYFSSDHAICNRTTPSKRSELACPLPR